jgi:hypothetical protein
MMESGGPDHGYTLVIHAVWNKLNMQPYMLTFQEQHVTPL